MKHLYSFLSCFFLLSILSPLISYGQGGGCSNQLTFFINGTQQGDKVPQGGSGVASSLFCPNDANSNTITLSSTSSTSEAVFSWDRVTKNAAGQTVLTPISGFRVEGSSTFLTVSPDFETVYRITSVACQGKITYVDFTITPTLVVTSSSGGAIVCPGTPIRLTATGASQGSTYTLRANGEIMSSNLTGVFDVTPRTSTIYEITTNTANCSGPVSQQIQVATNNISLTSSDADNSIASGTSVTLTAGDGTGYTWSQRNPTLTQRSETGNTITVSPTVTTVYTVSGVTTVGNCPTSTSVTITVDNKPLPVELTKFEARWVGNSPKLTWTTASEKNNAYFEIERSIDGYAFQVVGNRSGAGTVTSRTDYQFIDAEVAQTVARTIYYRLRQVDNSGEAKYSAVRVVSVPGISSATSKASVFPNPFEEEVSIQFYAQAAGDASISIHDVLGQTLITKTQSVGIGPHEIKLPQASSLPSGIYYLIIRQGKQREVVRISHR